MQAMLLICKHALCNHRLILSSVCCKFFTADFCKHDSFCIHDSCFTIKVHVACITNALDHGNFIYYYFVYNNSTFSEHCKLIKYAFKANCKSVLMNNIV